MICPHCNKAIEMKKTLERKKEDVLAVRKLIDNYMPIRDACKQVGISSDSFYKWSEQMEEKPNSQRRWKR
jgi:transposase-like protein